MFNLADARWGEMLEYDAGLFSRKGLRLLTPEARILFHLMTSGPMSVTTAIQVARTAQEGRTDRVREEPGRPAFAHADGGHSRCRAGSGRKPILGSVTLLDHRLLLRRRRRLGNLGCLAAAWLGVSVVAEAQEPAAGAAAPAESDLQASGRAASGSDTAAPSGPRPSMGEVPAPTALPAAVPSATSGTSAEASSLGLPQTATPAAAPSAAAAGETPSSESATGRDAASAAASVPVPAATGGELDVTKAVYGPPAPKVERGKLAEIDWPEAPGMIPPALEQAVRIVTRNYPSANSARAALRAANSDVKAAKLQRFPSVSANLAYLNASNGAPAATPQIGVELPLFTAGRIGAEIRRAKAVEDVSSASYVETVQTLALTLSDTYFQIAQLAEREKLLMESLAAHNKLVTTMENRVQQEVSPLADLELARSRTAQVEQDANITRAQKLTALRIFAELVAQADYDIGPTPRFDERWTIDSPETLENQAVTYDPRLRRLTSSIDVARAEYDARRAAIFPQLNAQYSYDTFYKSRAGLVVRAQAAGGFGQISTANAARIRIQGAFEDERVANQELRRIVANDVITFEAARSRASISLRAADTALSVSESYVRQFIAGRRTWLDVMNALREASTAQIGRSDAQVTAMAAAVRLQLRSGRWRPTFANPEQQAP
jgi:adhesin transport system outer membrane protein